MKFFKDISFCCIVLIIVIWMVVHHLLSNTKILEGQTNNDCKDGQLCLEIELEKKMDSEEKEVEDGSKPDVPEGFSQGLPGALTY